MKRQPSSGRNSLRSDKRGSIALIFAILMIPLTLMTALTVDYAFYVQAKSQLNLAADAAALHAVRIASNAYQNGWLSTYLATVEGQTAGQQWFSAQLGTLADATNATANVQVAYNSAPGSYTATVSYTASLPTNFGGIVPSSWASWPISGTSSSTATAGYVEVLLMVDNSSSMLIAATNSDMLNLEEATPCASMAGNVILSGAFTLDTSLYSWNYTGSYGYPSYFLNSYSSSAKGAPTSPTNGSCDSGYDGPSNLCFYMPTTLSSVINSSTGRCKTGGSNSSDPSGQPVNTPQAPCAFACHWDSGNNDYYGLAKSLGITMRLDVVHQAAENVISTLQSSQQFANQFSVGYYEFNSALTNVYPGTGEAGTNLSTAYSDVQNLSPPITPITLDFNTDFTTSMTSLNANVTAAGNGLSPTTPLKTLIIVTDGLNDVTSNQTTGPIDSTQCTNFKNKGFQVYVLYTNYLPFPSVNYAGKTVGSTTFAGKVKSYIEPSGSSPIEAAMLACSSGSNYYFSASDTNDILTAMTSIIQSALATPGRVTQ